MSQLGHGRTSLTTPVQNHRRSSSPVQQTSRYACQTPERTGSSAIPVFGEREGAAHTPGRFSRAEAECNRPGPRRIRNL